MKPKIEIVISDRDFIGEDEIAIYMDKEEIFSLSLNCITKVCRKIGFKNFVFIQRMSSERVEFTDIYLDNFGDALIVNYRPAGIEIEHEDSVLTLIGYSIDPVAELYLDYSGTSVYIDLKEYIRLYEKNVFESVVEKIKKKLLEKNLDLNKIFV
jgi:hypothetical protein